MVVLSPVMCLSKRDCQDVGVELLKEEESEKELGRKSVCADDSHPRSN